MVYTPEELDEAWAAVVAECATQHQSPYLTETQKRQVAARFQTADQEQAS